MVLVVCQLQTNVALLMNSTTNFAFQPQGMRLCSTCLTWISRTAIPGISPSMLLYSKRHQCTPPLTICSHFAKLDCTSSKSLATGTVHSQLLETPVKCSFLHLLICLNSVGLHRLTACNHETQQPKPHLRLLIIQSKVCIGLNYSLAKQWNSASCELQPTHVLRQCSRLAQRNTQRHIPHSVSKNFTALCKSFC